MSLVENIINSRSLLTGDAGSFALADRETALESFLRLGFPGKKDEEYKYTNLREITELDYTLTPKTEHTLSAATVDELHLGEENFDWVVFVNGVLRKDLSRVTVEGVDLLYFNCDLDRAPQVFGSHLNSLANAELAFTQLNTAFFRPGFFLRVPKNTIVEKPLHVFYLSQNQEENVMYNTRNILIAEEGAHIEVIESHHNFDPSFVFTNSVTEIFTAPNGKADWHKLQNDSDTSFLVDHTFARQERDSLTTVNTFSFGGKLVRNNLDFIHTGQNINSFMNGITIIDDHQLVDHHTAVHHNTPNCESYQNYKGIYRGNSHGVFNGKVFVDKIAQKTNAYQQNNNVLLSEGARIDTKPQLEIFADDVKCSHGCTVGQLNEEALFYLRARGISKREAQAMLLFAFANDAMQNIDIEELKIKVSKLLAQKLEVDIAFEELV